MKEQTRIPTSKVERASRFMATGVKVGSNYLKYYAKKAVTNEASREDLDDENAEDIYAFLSKMKGSALKAAQMLSMDQGLLPPAYASKFQMAQYSAPPLSYPLVVKTFKKYFKKRPDELFDAFSTKAVNAASIGQVHLAELNGQKLAVKVQYPGVSESVSNDLKMAKPLAARIMKVKASDLTNYMAEVEEKLLEETNYLLELERSIAISQQCDHFENIVFPKYYPELSARHVLTMDWIDGMHVDAWIKTNPPQEMRNRIGQDLWDFYQYQMHTLKLVHADPHPGNFIITPDQELAIIDFGCVKEVPEDFYRLYFRFLVDGVLTDDEVFERQLRDLDFIYPHDTPEHIRMFKGIFRNMIQLLNLPFQSEYFDFDDDPYFAKIYRMVDELSRDKKLRNANTARGSRHGIYVNRTYFGLYNLLHQLRAEVRTVLPEAVHKVLATAHS